MKDHLFALGVSCIELVQYWCSDYALFFEKVNNFYNPKNVLDVLFPVVSFVDSVFASQLLLVTAFGGWLNCILKWLLLEDRPYWWVRETDYYDGSVRPHLLQTDQTCETGPGNPSGHTATAASVLVLIIMWISHIFNDRKWQSAYWKLAAYPVLASQLLSVMLARMYIATHFPHQCLLGAVIGAIIAPALCIYVTDPYIWNYGWYPTIPPGRVIRWHMFFAVTSITVGLVTYFSLLLCDIDPHITVEMAFKWCQDPDKIHASTTPVFALVQSTGSMLGWSMFVTPAIAKFRHDTYKRSFLISAFATVITTYALQCIEWFFPEPTTSAYLLCNFLLNIFKPLLYLRVLPALSMWPYEDKN